MGYLSKTLESSVLAYLTGHPHFLQQVPSKTVFNDTLSKETQEKREDILFISEILLNLLVYWIAHNSAAEQLKNFPGYSSRGGQQEGATGVSYLSIVSTIIRGRYESWDRVEHSANLNFIPFQESLAQPEHLALFAQDINNYLNFQNEFKRLSEATKRLILFIERKLLNYFGPDEDEVNFVLMLINEIRGNN